MRKIKSTERLSLKEYRYEVLHWFEWNLAKRSIKQTDPY